MIVHTHEVATRSPSDPHVRDARRSLTVHAKLAMCLQPEFDQVSIGVIDSTGDLSTWAQEGELAITAPLVARVLASQVASVLAGVHEIRHLRRALDVSTTMGQATGLTMAQLELDADHAAAHLRRVSMLRNQKLAQVADDLVRTRRLPPEPPD